VNFTRPSIDVAFRSAAKEFGPRAIGVILSGYLDDGTAGLLSIKRAGGITVVQDPADAEVDSMPRTAARYCKPDHQVAASEIGQLLNTFAHERRGHQDLDMGRDAGEITAKIATDVAEQEKNERKGELSIFSCPECGGTLWQAGDEGPLRFQCHIGHAYTGDHLLKQKLETVERSGWYTMRALKETVLLTNELSLLAEQDGNAATAEEFRRQSRLADSLLHKLEELLMQSHDPAA
jgi:two-component system chemotaxis response regulator CheB